jgi:hypothetical protein
VASKKLSFCIIIFLSKIFATSPVDNMFVTLSLHFRRTGRGGSGSPGPIRDHGLGQSPADDHGQDHDQGDEKQSKSLFKGSGQVLDIL